MFSCRCLGLHTSQRYAEQKPGEVKKKTKTPGCLDAFKRRFSSRNPSPTTTITLVSGPLTLSEQPVPSVACTSEKHSPRPEPVVSAPAVHTVTPLISHPLNLLSAPTPISGHVIDGETLERGLKAQFPSFTDAIDSLIEPTFSYCYALHDGLVLLYPIPDITEHKSEFSPNFPWNNGSQFNQITLLDFNQEQDGYPARIKFSDLTTSHPIFPALPSWLKSVATEHSANLTLSEYHHSKLFKFLLSLGTIFATAEVPESLLNTRDQLACLIQNTVLTYITTQGEISLGATPQETINIKRDYNIAFSRLLTAHISLESKSEDTSGIFGHKECLTFISSLKTTRSKIIFAYLLGKLAGSKGLGLKTNCEDFSSPWLASLAHTCFKFLYDSYKPQLEVHTPKRTPATGTRSRKILPKLEPQPKNDIRFPVNFKTRITTDCINLLSDDFLRANTILDTTIFATKGR